MNNTNQTPNKRPAGTTQSRQQAGARPAASGARPAANGARPAANGARPAANGARPQQTVQSPQQAVQSPQAQEHLSLLRKRNAASIKTASSY